VGLLHRLLQALQGCDHLVAPLEIRAARVGTELPLPAEPHDHEAGQDAEDELGDDRGDEECGPVAPLGLEHHPVHEMSHDAGEEHDEGVDDTLDQGKGDHVPVGHVADLVAQDGLHFAAGHRAQQPRADGNQGAVSAHARGEGVRVGRIVDCHVGHADPRGRRLALHGVHQPGLDLVGRLRDHAGPRHAQGGPLRQGQGHEGPPEAEDGGEDQQVRHLEGDALLVEDAFDPEQAKHDAQDQNDGQVGDDEEHDAFHGNSS